jgi:hypothetical protein
LRGRFVRRFGTALVSNVDGLLCNIRGFHGLARGLARCDDGAGFIRRRGRGEEFGKWNRPFGPSIAGPEPGPLPVRRIRVPAGLDVAHERIVSACGKEGDPIGWPPESGGGRGPRATRLAVGGTVV